MATAAPTPSHGRVGERVIREENAVTLAELYAQARLAIPEDPDKKVRAVTPFPALVDGELVTVETVLERTAIVHSPDDVSRDRRPVPFRNLWVDPRSVRIVGLHDPRAARAARGRGSRRSASQLTAKLAAAARHRRLLAEIMARHDDRRASAVAIEGGEDADRARLRRDLAAWYEGFKALDLGDGPSTTAEAV